MPVSGSTEAAAAPSDAFSTGVAEHLIDVFRNGLLAGDPRRTLADFDRQTPVYAQLADDLASLFRRYESLRVYTHVLRTESEGARGVATVDFTLEAQPVTSNQPAVRRNAQLRLTFAREGKDWKIIELEPRDFLAKF